MLQKRRNEVGFPGPWDLQVDRAHAGVDRALPRPIAVVQAAFLAAVMLGPDELVKLGVDRALGHRAHQILEDVVGL